MSTEKQLISVVMPVRNGGDYLQPAVDSVLRQSHSQIELIIVDDHSTDNSVAGLRNLDDRVTRIESKERGVALAFNEGFQVSKGDYVARMDADDISLPQRLQAQLQYLNENPAVDIVSCCVEFFASDPILGGLQRYQKWLNGVRTPEQIHQQIFIESPMPNPGVVFRRKALLELGGYRDLTWPEDYDLFLRADAAGLKMGKPDPVLLRWREHGSRLTHTNGVYAREQFMRAKAHFLVKHRLPDIEAQSSKLVGDYHAPIIWGAGKTGRLLHDLIVEQGGQLGGFIDVHPRRIGKQKRSLPVWPIEKAADASCPMVLVAVGAAGARQKIAVFMAQHNKREGHDFLFVA